MLNELFGPSIHLLILDLFLENPRELMNLREIARRIEKNPGSISRVMPRMIEHNLLKQIKVGQVSYIYQLNIESELVQLIIEFNNKVKKQEYNFKIK